MFNYFLLLSTNLKLRSPLLNYPAKLGETSPQGGGGCKSPLIR